MDVLLVQVWLSDSLVTLFEPRCLGFAAKFKHTRR